MTLKKLAACLLLVGIVIAPPARAVTYEPEPFRFCSGQAVHDFLRPFKRMPELREPRPDGTLPFGPPTLRVKWRDRMFTSGQYVGFVLYLYRRSPAAQLGWRASVTLSRVDWKGRRMKTIEVSRRRIPYLAKDHSASFSYGIVERVPGPYRVTAVIFNRQGRKIGGFGSYFRLVKPTYRPRLGLTADSYRRGSTAFGRLENFGTVLLDTPREFWIERFDGSSWSPIPETPRGWIGNELVEPGTSGACSAFDIPPTMPPGRYRMVRPITLLSSEGRAAGEFLVLP
ncbi:MAG TPA: hypothetical protein VFT79_05400 [Solirubrobacterales bacterium]|nr:hypothetical protein [Solirubrobacterales bacterium]